VTPSRAPSALPRGGGITLTPTVYNLMGTPPFA
jgi:hypothetical protein